ncbi:MAG: cyclodeaminase/cyclohydrolase family protein [Dehalobacterium sp.]
MLKNLPLTEFIDELASSSPAPGGGSVSALAGSLSSALVYMVINLTISKEKFKEVEAEFNSLIQEVNDLKNRLCNYIDKDTEAFDKVMEAFKLPKNNEAEKEFRINSIQEATKYAALLPLEVAKDCLGAMYLAKSVSEKGNPNALSDAGVACLMAYAGLHGALLNVEINIGSIKDPLFVSELNSKKESILHEGKQLQEEILKAIHHKLGN